MAVVGAPSAAGQTAEARRQDEAWAQEKAQKDEEEDRKREAKVRIQKEANVAVALTAGEKEKARQETEETMATASGSLDLPTVENFNAAASAVPAAKRMAAVEMILNALVLRPK